MSKTEKEFAGKEQRSPWTFKAPAYDDRNKVSAGNVFGVGVKQPVGHGGDDAKQNAECLPQERYSKPL